MKVTSKSKNLPCKNSLLEINPLTVKCKLTKKVCCIFYDTRSLGAYVFKEDLERCPAFIKKNKKKKRSKI